MREKDDPGIVGPIVEFDAALTGVGLEIGGGVAQSKSHGGGLLALRFLVSPFARFYPLVSPFRQVNAVAKKHQCHTVEYTQTTFFMRSTYSMRTVA
jgi:hypothetical protein